jgi:hypothetical protein
LRGVRPLARSRGARPGPLGVLGATFALEAQGKPLLAIGRPSEEILMPG